MPTHSPEESKRYREKHREEIKIRKRLDYLKHKEAYKARAEKNELKYRSTPESLAAFLALKRTHDAKYRKKPERRVWKKKYMESYRAANREKFTEYERRRNAKKYGVAYEKVDYEALYKASPECFYCGKHLQRNEVHYDHHIPLNRGGAHIASNIKVSCAPCNLSKHDKMPEEFELIRARAGEQSVGMRSHSPASAF